MIKYFSILLLDLVLSIPLFAQFQVEGKIVNLEDKNPISFVNIGIVNTSAGTISNEDGSFSIVIPKKYINDTIIFSALGYGQMHIPVSDLSEEDFYTIYLKETPKKLNTVIVIGESWKGKKYRMGSDHVDGSCLYADTVTAGSAIALLIKANTLKNKDHLDFPMFISRAHVEVADNTFDEFKIRARIYELDTATGLPGRDLLNESVVTSSTLENGRLDIDLSKYNIEIYGDFYLGFEWILDKYDRKNLFLQYEGFRKDHPDKVVTNYVKIDGERIPYLNYQGNLYAGPSFGISVSQGSLKNNMCFYRLNSFGRWYRCPSILAAGVVLSDQPYPIAGENLTAENVSDERIEALLPYYKIERLPFDAKNEEFIWHLHPDDTGFFAQKMREAITIEVRRQVNKLSFYAKNNSFYPYQLEMNFSKMVNLRPIVSRKTYTVYPGINKLLEFNVVDPSIENFHYELSTKEIIGDPDNIPIRTYPYLFPLGKSHEVRLNVSEPSDNYIAFDEFKLNSNDTVYAMRKGIVGATPVMGKNVDRISARETLEIIHPDGTIMIYDNLNPQNIFVTAGEVVYPCQPLGIIEPSNIIRVELFKISRLGRLERLDISYYTGEDDNRFKNTLTDGFVVSCPDTIIIKEMTEQEVNKYRSRTLY